MTKYICPQRCSEDLSGRLIQPTCVPDPILMIVGEAPGEEEEKHRRFFEGKAGQELTNYLDRVGIPRNRCWITNVLKCRPPGNRDPRVGEIEVCSQVLRQEMEECRPRFIATVGRFATQFFLGDVNMEMVHGIPYRVAMEWGSCTIIPVYHPAAGLHDTTNMSNIMADFMAVKRAMTSSIPVRNVGDHLNPPPFHLVEMGEDPTPYLTGLVAIDTETQDEDDAPWCLQFCCGEQGHIIMADNHVSLAIFALHISRPEVLCVIQNSLFDLKVLFSMGMAPAQFTDTMVMAYLLQTEPQGLKPLTYRHLQVKMLEYDEVVGPRTQEMALEYVVQVACTEWPKLPPVLEMKAGKPHIRQPQTINQKVNRILNDLAAGKEVDVYDRWKKTPLSDGREMVEQQMGVLTKAYLKDVSKDEALQYAATDVWATYHIYPILLKKIQALGLEEVLNRDLRMIPMVETMQRVGMPIDPLYFESLRSEFTGEMDQVTSKIVGMVGDIHPGSDPQVLALLERLNLAKAKRKYVGGKEVVIRKKTTDLNALELIKDLHPVVPLIMRYRLLAKLVDSFVDTLLEKKVWVEGGWRIRTTLRVTRVVTGRLASSNPNLMAMPTRTEDGRRIREGFVAPNGYVFCSGDYSQIEMRAVADISQDTNMMHVFNTGQDIHTFTAMGMFHLEAKEVDEMKHRYPAKRVGFGILNLISAGKLLKELTVGGAEGWTEAGCQSMIDDWFRLYYGVAAYVEERKAEARRTGMVRDMFGRVRLVPEVMSVHRSVVEAGIRQAVNAPIQMSAQGIIKEAMGQLVPLYKEFGEDVVCPLIQIHDDIVWLIKEDTVGLVIPMVKEVMENCVQLSVPIKVDFKTGPRWSNMEKWKG